MKIKLRVFIFINFCFIALSMEKISDCDFQNNLNKQLIFTVANNNFKKTKHLIAKGANIDYVFSISRYTGDGTTNNFTALIIAIMNDNIELVYFLLINGLNINKKVMFGNYEVNALLVAIYYNRIEILKKLINFGADVNIKYKTGYNNNTRSALEFAIKRKSESSIKLLLRIGARLSRKRGSF